jgi:dynein heavy chain
MFGSYVQVFYDSLIAASLDEIHSDYQAAMKKSILDYILASPVEMHRLFLDPLKPFLQPTAKHSISAATTSSSSSSNQEFSPGESYKAVATRQIPERWREHVALAREEIAWTLQTLNANVLELGRLWYEAGYANARLVDLKDEEFIQRLPVQVCRPDRKHLGL